MLNKFQKKGLMFINKYVRSLEMRNYKKLSILDRRFLSKVASFLNGNIRVKSSEEIFNLFVMLKTGDNPKNNLDYYLKELSSNELMSNQMIYADKKYGHVPKFYDFNHKVKSNQGLAALYYALVREIRPKSILETGTAWGSMTSFMLCALAKNKKGKLTSIDLPPDKGKLNMDVTINKDNIGLYIPDDYKDRHKVIFGDAKQILPIYLVSEKVDFFVHDSLHSHLHMAFEYRTAINLMPKDAIILSDDVLYWNTAFHSFCKEHSLEGFSPIENLNTGILLNRVSLKEQKYTGPSRVGGYKIHSP